VSIFQDVIFLTCCSRISFSDPFLLFVAIVVVVSYISGMYTNLYKPLPLLLGLWLLACSVSMILLMEQAVLVQHLSLLQR
jgi:hypothetical protein